MKFPIGIQDFKSIIKDGYLYIDKTDLVYQLVKGGKTYFLSRPRRFGKSLLVSTLEYYFKGERELFKGLAIDALEKDWESYPVFHVDFNGTNFTEAGALQGIVKGLVESWEKQYGFQPNTDYTYGQRFCELLAHVHHTTGKRCVVLIDEYDKPLLDVMDTDYKMEMNGEMRLIEDCNRETLKGFYSTFKAADAHLQFVLLTGVTKFSQVSVFSGFNQPMDISMNRQYDAICGITKDELITQLDEPVANMALALGLDKEEMIERLVKQYDGYHFSRGMVDMFNPFSVLNALNEQELRSYWFATGTPTYLIRLLKHNHENLNDLTGHYYRPADFVDYKADIENPLAMTYQSGYLTIKSYNPRFGTYMLDLPNNEVKEGFVSLLANSYLQIRRDTATTAMDWVTTLESGDLNLLHKQLTAFFASIPYSMRRKENERERERYFHYTFYLMFRLMSTYLVLTEKQQSEGRADCIIETPEYVYIFEFKLDGTAAEALAQIETCGYARPYAADKRHLHKVGASFSSQTGTIEEWLVED